MGEEVSNAREVFTFQLAATGLLNVETFSKSDPFLEISRQQEDGRWLPVYKVGSRGSAWGNAQCMVMGRTLIG